MDVGPQAVAGLLCHHQVVAVGYQVAVAGDYVLRIYHPQKLPMILSAGVTRDMDVVVYPGAPHLELGRHCIAIGDVQRLGYYAGTKHDFVSGLNQVLGLSIGNSAENSTGLTLMASHNGEVLVLSLGHDPLQSLVHRLSAAVDSQPIVPLGIACSYCCAPVLLHGPTQKNWLSAHFV